MKASDVLIGAAEAIQEHGWCQGVYVNRAGCFCIAGAIRHIVAVTAPEYQAARNLVTRHVGMPLIDWNDLPYMTKEVVVSTLLQTAVEAAKAGE